MTPNQLPIPRHGARRNLRRLLETAIVAALFGTSSQMALPAPAGAAEKVTLMLNWLPGGAHVPIFYARDAGFYRKAGIEVDIRNARGSRNAFEALRKGDAQFAIAEATELFIGRDNGLDVVGTMVYFQRSPNAIIALKNKKGIARLADLAGKEIGAPRSSFPRVLFKEIGDRGKVDLKRVKWQNLSTGEMLPALVSGKVDAVASSLMVAYQYRQAARKAGKSVTVLPYADAGVNPYSLLLVSVDSFLGKSPRVAAAFVRATAEAMAASLRNPRKAFELFLKDNPGLGRARAEAEWRTAISLIAPPKGSKTALGHFDARRMENMRVLLSHIRDFGPRMDTPNLYTNRLLPSLRPTPARF